MKSNAIARFGVTALALAVLVLPMTTVAHAQNATNPTQLSVTQAASSVDVTVFGDGFAQVEETRQVKLNAGRNQIQLNGVAGKYRADSLRIIDVKGNGSFTYKSATYQPANLTAERILELSVGQTVTATVGNGATARHVTGTLTSVRGGQAIITANDGTTYLTGTSDISVPKLPSGLSATASLTIEADVSAAGTYDLHFLYETEGLSWSAKHSAIYNDETRKVESFETTVNVVNQSGTSFENANLYLLSGAVRDRGGRVAAASYARSAEMMDAPGGAAVESVGERKVYRIKDRVTLGDGQSRQIPLFTGSNIPVEHEYYLPANSYVYDQGTGAQPVSVRLRVKNCDEHGLGTPLPAGLVKVYQRNSEKKLQLTSSTNVKELARDEVFEISLGTSSDVKAERNLTKASPVQPAPRTNPNQPVYQDQEFEVTVHNFKTGKAVDVVVEVNVPAEQQTVQPLTRKNAQQANGTVHVEAGKKSTLTYTLKVRTN